MGKLQGKVALVTGSGRNIGRATVLHLARAGAHVIVNARSNHAEADAVVREAQALGVRAISIIADMAKKDEVEAMAAKALSEFGRVDILINNAAIRPHMPFRELTDEDWEHVRNVVLDGALYLTRALIGPMVENKYGNILFFVGDGAYSGRGDLVDLPLPPERDAGSVRRTVAIPFGIVAPGVDAARRDDIYPDVVRREFRGEPARQTDQRHLGC